jgi:beta-propeller repeat-containing protein
MRTRSLCAVPVAVLALIPLAGGPANVKLTPQRTAAGPQIQASYGKLPLAFEANRGQTSAKVDFLARGEGYTIFLTRREAVLRLQSPQQKRATVSVGLAGANQHPRVLARQRLPGNVNYLLGSDPRRWHTNVPTFAEIAYRSVYPGIDLEYHGNHGRLESDFVVRPGANPEAIAVRLSGAKDLRITRGGNALVRVHRGTLVLHKPLAYQDVDGRRAVIDSSYVLRGGQIGFSLGRYDTSKQLVIDPILFYSTYLGGSDEDAGLSVAVDAAGNAYVDGRTISADFPTTPGAFRTTAPGGRFDVFVSKLNPTGSALVYSTYLGGSSDDVSRAIATDGVGNAYVTGFTSSGDFPTTPAAFDTAQNSLDAFVTKLDATGSALVYSTYLGGSGGDGGQAIAVDPSGSAYVTGATNSADFPTTPGSFQSSSPNGSDAFVTKFDPAGSSLLYSTYLGGATGGEQGNGIAVDAVGATYVDGFTGSTDFPTSPGAFQATTGGSDDGFVTKLNQTASVLLYSSYLGGSGADVAHAIALDTSGNAFATGDTLSTDFPTTPGSFQPSPGGGVFDAFVTKVNVGGTGLVYSSYLSGSGQEEGFGIAVDSSGAAYAVGSTNSANFPTTAGAFQPTLAGLNDAYVTKFNAAGSGLVYSTYLGGSENDNGDAVALDLLPNPNAYVAGETRSTDFPTTPGAFQTSYAGGVSDGFVSKITDIVLPPPPPPPTTGKVTGGGAIDVGGGIGTFGFIVQRQSLSGPIRGDLQYVNHASGAKVHSVDFLSFVVAGNTATFSGDCLLNGATPCTFTVHVVDNGEPGRNDTFTISVSGGPTEGGTLRSGNIQIHP